MISLHEIPGIYKHFFDQWNYCEKTLQFIPNVSMVDGEDGVTWKPTVKELKDSNYGENTPLTPQGVNYFNTLENDSEKLGARAFLITLKIAGEISTNDDDTFPDSLDSEPDDYLSLLSCRITSYFTYLCLTECTDRSEDNSVILMDANSKLYNAIWKTFSSLDELKTNSVYIVQIVTNSYFGKQPWHTFIMKKVDDIEYEILTSWRSSELHKELEYNLFTKDVIDELLNTTVDGKGLYTSGLKDIDKVEHVFGVKTKLYANTKRYFKYYEIFY